jgi:glyoxylase-like metal-dependent hydrolase (beta-lactamase superfamily II)
MFPEADIEAFRRLGGVDAEGLASALLTTFIVRAGGRLILVDTGIGPDLGSLARAGFTGEVGFLPEALRAARVEPERVDTVVITHVHADHIGWNTTGPVESPAVTFPNATFVVTQTEWEHREKVAGGQNTTRLLTPVEASGQLLLAEDGHEVAPGISLFATPGHTPGHTSVLLVDGGAGAIITGDAAHHPAEIEDPEIHAAFDSDPAQSTRSRIKLVERADADGLVVLGNHFPPPTAGSIVRVGAKRRWQWLGGG